MKSNTDAIFRESLARCHAIGMFLENFYENFMASSPQVRKLFEGVEMERQVSMLRGSLYLMIHAGGQSENASNYVSDLGQRHHALGVQPVMYDWWLESLLQTVQECDPMFTPEVAAAWRTVLGRGIAVMKASSDELADNRQC